MRKIMEMQAQKGKLRCVETASKRPIHALFIVAGFCLFLTACESLVGIVPESKLPHVKSKLVVHSFISPQDTALYVMVTESVPIFGEVEVGTGQRDRVISKATVSFSNGAGKIDLKYDPVNQLYSAPTSSFPIQPGHTYVLQVTDGERSVKATTTVPEQSAAISSYRMDTIYARSGFFASIADTLLTMRFSWRDLSGKQNYYRARSLLNVSDISEQLDNDGKVIRQISTYTLMWKNSFISDNNLDGSLLSSEEARYSLSNIGWIGPPRNTYPRYRRKINFVDLELYHTTKEYFDYHRSVQTANRADDNPFAEPGITFSNVEGGLGVLASYNKFALRVYLESGK